MNRLLITYWVLLFITSLLWNLQEKAGCETLQDAWDTAIAVDHGLEARGKITESSEKELDAAKATRLPQLKFRGGYTMLDNPPALIWDTSPQPIEIPVGEDKSYFTGTTVTLPLFTSGRIKNGITAADYGVRAAQISRQQATKDLKLEVAEAYVLVLRAKRALAVTESHVKSLQAHAEKVSDLGEQGFVAQNDLLAVRVALADARQQRLQAQNGLDMASAAYNRLLGRNLAEPVDIEDIQDMEFGPSDGSLEELTQKALENRLELEGIDMGIKALEHQAAMELAAYGPQAALSGNWGFQENRYQVHEEIWSATIGVEFCLDAGVSKYRSDAIKKRKEALWEQQAELKMLISLQVRQAWLDIETERERVQVTRQALEQGEENLKVTQDRYREGLAINTEVLDAEALRMLNFVSHNNAVYNLCFAILELRYAIGEL